VCSSDLPKTPKPLTMVIRINRANNLKNEVKLLSFSPISKNHSDSYSFRIKKS